jgi:hypothetical protein
MCIVAPVIFGDCVVVISSKERKSQTNPITISNLVYNYIIINIMMVVVAAIINSKFVGLYCP